MDKLSVLLLTALLLAGACVRAQDGPKTTTTTTEEPSTMTPSTMTPSTTTPSTTTPSTTTPSSTTTEEPITTTTEEPTTTTTEEPTTTTTEEPTTTTEATTTLAPTPSPTPAPVENFFMVTEGNLTCIIVNADISASVTYNKDNTSAVHVVKFPKDPKGGAIATGTCAGTAGEQSIAVTWGGANASSAFKMVFNKTKTAEWSLLSFTADLFMDASVFNSASVDGKVLHLTVPLSMIDVPVNRSYDCVNKALLSNVSATLDGKPYTLNVDVSMEKTQIEAFNEINFEKDFLDVVHCDADKTSDIVPITVGCALAALVIIVLIAYLIGRRRRSAAYQSV